MARRRPRLAVATCADYPTLVPDDLPLLQGLERRGLAAEPVLWDAPGDWRRYDAVLLRSVWDYFLRPREFRAWLDGLEAAGLACWNPPDLIRWNLDKRYLRDLAARGVPTVETLWVGTGEEAAPDVAVERILGTGWSEVVVKPAVSAGAWRTLRLSREDVRARREELGRTFAEGCWMAQPFLPEIVRDGEWSFVFFDGTFSHAVLKRPRAGDFRVQWTHGGSHAAVGATPGLLAQAAAVVAAAPSPGLYARVDGIVRGGRLVLVELEQIEPYLFLGEAPGSAERLADALCARLAAGRGSGAPPAPRAGRPAS